MIEISEIYPAIEGETTYSGEPCTIIRLAGCNLNCVWCDTPQAKETGRNLSIEEIIETCKKIGMNLILVTGGEPLMQKEVPELLSRLIESGFRILLETNGSFPLDSIPREAVVILDIKCPGSGMRERMNFDNLDKIRKSDEVKFIICDRGDFDYAIDLVKKRHLLEKTRVLFSPEFERMNPANLADWILETRLPIRLNLQIHKYIWDPGEKSR
ncbi:radical SAM protein [Candidatus Sumerlaeota bacterium]|nr:radical SAM protein [Candidatus Sumerlaeota bacterium]